MTGEVIALNAAIQDLYTAFRVYDVGRLHDSGCPHCVTDADHARILSNPISNLSAQDLERFAFKAGTTWGTADDFRRFLPRILELLPGELSELMDASIILSKLARFSWSTWPNEERVAIGRYLWALWEVVLGTDRWGSLTPEDLLEAYSGLFDDVSAFLDSWERNHGKAATVALARMVESHADELARNGRVARTYSQDADRTLVSQWLLAPARLLQLESGFFASDDPDEIATISRAVDCLHWTRTAT